MADSGKAKSDPKAAAVNNGPKVKNTQSVKLPRNIPGQNKKGHGNKGLYQ